MLRPLILRIVPMFLVPAVVPSWADPSFAALFPRTVLVEEFGYAA